MPSASAPNFCPPTEEGVTISLEDENGVATTFEFLGSIIHDAREFGFFFPVLDEDEFTGEVVILEILAYDDDDQPSEFELLEDEDLADDVYEEFREAAGDLYDFQDE